MSWAKYSGFHFATAQGLIPAAASTTTNGYVVDRLSYSHAIVVATAGAITGSGTVNIKVQDSADGTTGWADYTPPTLYDNNANGATIAEFPTISGAGGYKLDVDLSGAKRYVRLVAVIASGTNVLVGAVWLLDQRDGNVPGATA